MFSISVFRVVARALLFYYNSQNIRQLLDYYLPFLRHYYRFFYHTLHSVTTSTFHPKIIALLSTLRKAEQS